MASSLAIFASRNEIFAKAYSQDPDFFSFYRSMQAYEAGLKPGDTRLLLRPDTSFFRYFNSPAGAGDSAAGPASGPAAPRPPGAPSASR